MRSHARLPRNIAGIVIACLVVVLAGCGSQSGRTAPPVSTAATPTAAAASTGDPTCQAVGQDVQQKQDAFLRQHGLQPHTDGKGRQSYAYRVPDTGPNTVTIYFIRPPGNGSSVCGFTVTELDPHGNQVPADASRHVRIVTPDGKPAQPPTPAHFCVSQLPPEISTNPATKQSVVTQTCSIMAK